MRRLLALTFVLLLFPCLALAVTEDQEKVVAQISAVLGDQSIIFDSTPTAGCTAVFAAFIVWVSVDYNLAATPVDDNQGNTYTTTASTVAGREQVILARADNITASGTFTITFHPDVTAGNFYATFVAKSFCGLANPAGDQTGTADDAGPQGSDATVSTSSPTSQANETLIAAVAICNTTSNINITAPAGWTSISTEQDCDAHAVGNISWKNETTTGTKTASWSHDDVTGTGTYDGWSAAILSLKDAVPGGGAVRRRAVIVQ